jgi:hypothetical protein
VHIHLAVKVWTWTLCWRTPGQLQRALEAGLGVLGQTRGVPEHMYSPGHAPSLGVPVQYHSCCSRAGSGAKGDKGNSSRRKVRESVQSVSAVDHPGGSQASSRGGGPEEGSCQMEAQEVKAKEGWKEL